MIQTTDNITPPWRRGSLSRGGESPVTRRRSRPPFHRCAPRTIEFRIPGASQNAHLRYLGADEARRYNARLDCWRQNARARRSSPANDGGRTQFFFLPQERRAAGQSVD